MEAEAIVVELLPSATYRVRLENNDRVLAHAAGAAAENFMRLASGRPGASGVIAARSGPGPDCGEF